MFQMNLQLFAHKKGVGFKDDNADGKTRGFQTLIGGAIIAAVGALVPSTISLGG